jgi:hypothetical protein
MTTAPVNIGAVVLLLASACTASACVLIRIPACRCQCRLWFSTCWTAYSCSGLPAPAPPAPELTRIPWILCRYPCLYWFSMCWIACSCSGLPVPEPLYNGMDGCNEVQSVRSVRVPSVPVLARMQYQYGRMVGQGRPEQLYLKQQ